MAMTKRPSLSARCLTVNVFLLQNILPSGQSFQLQSSSSIPKISREELHDFLATPTHWPQIVLSSHSVKCPSFADNRVDGPLCEGEFVEEVFGLPPLLPLSVVWQCVKSDPRGGALEFYSAAGVPGLADECRMRFDIREEPNGGTCAVNLTMDFEPRNPIITLGTPFLGADNTLALNVLLPRAVKRNR